VNRWKSHNGPPEIRRKNQPSSRRVLGCSGRTGLSLRVAGLGYGSSWFSSWVPPELLSSPEIDFWPPGIKSPSENAHRGSGLWVVRVTGLSLGFNGFRVSMGSWVNELAGIAPEIAVRRLCALLDGFRLPALSLTLNLSHGLYLCVSEIGEKGRKEV
jgi:hypothetical protein